VIGDSTPYTLMQRMLSLLSAGGVISPADLARRLGASEELVRLIAADLVRLGYLARAEAGCGGGCAGCGAASSCGGLGSAPGALLILTPKGRQAGSR
jgi:hypothetical protein